MKTFHKLLSLVLACLMCFSLAACSVEGKQKADMSGNFYKQLGQTKDEVYKFLGITEADTTPAEFGGTDLNEKFEYGGCEATVNLDFLEDEGGDIFSGVTYSFGTADKSGEGYQKAAFDFAKAVEKKLNAKYKVIEYYNGELNTLSEEAYKAGTDSAKWFGEYSGFKDKNNMLEKIKKIELWKDKPVDEMHVRVNIEKIDVDNVKAARVHVSLLPATKTKPQ